MNVDNGHFAHELEAKQAAVWISQLHLQSWWTVLLLSHAAGLDIIRLEWLPTLDKRSDGDIIALYKAGKKAL
jgi:hypothetical protein